MIKKTIAIAVITNLVFFSCKEKKNENENKLGTQTEQISTNEPTTETLTNNDGSKIEMTFDKKNNKVVVHFEDEKIELISQKPASGIWYKNDHYELRGKGKNIDLKKDGKIVFAHQGEEPIVNDYIGINGKTLTVNVYNDIETATVVYDGETIDLVSQRPASGIWYKNDQYELSGKGDNIELKKGDETIFRTKQ